MLTTLLEQAVGLRLLPTELIALIIVGALAVLYVYGGYISGRHQLTLTGSCRHHPRLKSLPIIGSIPFLPHYTQLHKFFFEKLSTLGPVVGFSLMTQQCVVLQTREAIAEAFAKTEVSDRPFRMFEDEASNTPKKGIFFREYNADFKKYHQLTLTIMKEFGFGKFGGIMEARIQSEVADMNAEIKAFGGRSVDPTRTVNKSVMNVIAGILFGKKFQRSDPQLSAFIDKAFQWSTSLANAIPVRLLPVLRYIPYFRRALQELDSVLEWYREVLKLKIQECKQGENQTPSFIRSFIEAEGQKYDEVQLIFTLRELIAAGSETGAAVIRYSIACLANNQEIQARLQAEVDSVVPRERLPSLGDQAQLTYVEAFILELMRHKSSVPLGIPHETSKDVVVQGFYIQANTIVSSNIYAVHMDPNTWGDPEKFRPDRFIDQNGEIINREKTIPFCVGKRSCLGELLARQELFLFISGLLQNFSVLPPEGCNTVEYDDVVGITTSPTPYEVRFLER